GRKPEGERVWGVQAGEWSNDGIAKREGKMRAGRGGRQRKGRRGCEKSGWGQGCREGGMVGRRGGAEGEECIISAGKKAREADGGGQET
ncbi:hypothetical protein B1218_38130, partial [Pseudomonas ogarae]